MFNIISNIFSKQKNQKSLHNHLQAQNLDSSYFYSFNKAAWSERDYKSFASEAYIKNVIAHRAIMMIAQGAASVPLELFEIKNQERILLNKHPLLDLLRRPNPLYSGKELLEQTYIYRLISGNAYVLAINLDNSEAKELVILRPDRVKVLMGHDYIPNGYRYEVNGHHTDYMLDQVTGKSSILHIKNFHPLSDWYGLSSVEAAAYSIDQHNQAGAWNQALLQNGARPSGALVVKDSDGKAANLSEEQFVRLKDMMESAFSGPENSGKPLLLEGGLEWQEMSLSPKDMDFIDSKHSSARDIALAFGMPPQLLGIPGDNTYSNLAEARIALWEQTIIPLVEDTVEALNHWLVPYFEGELEISYNLDSISALTEKRAMMWERIAKADFLTTNEKRRLIGFKPIEN